MAKIRDREVKSSSGSYDRIFNNKELGNLISKVQGTSISNGNELEKMVIERSNEIKNLDEFLKDCHKKAFGVYLCTKKTLKKSKLANGQEPDLLVFIIADDYVCKIIELKDGDNFDTKKSKGERDSLIRFRNHIGNAIQFKTEYYICSFNQDDKEEIYKGFKKEFEQDEILNGKDLCRILNIDYNDILMERKGDAADNLIYFVQELLKIKDVKDEILKQLNLPETLGGNDER